MIIFKKIRYKNLLSTGNLFTEIDLNSHNTTLIVGENGAGKSTILDALSYVLFGKAFRKINKPQLLNSITQKGLVVEVEFSIGLNNYKIIRGMKPGIFEVYQNDKLMNQSAEMKDYQEILEKQILKVNHKSFCQVVILGSATYQPFMQLTAYQRREIIEDLLDLQIFTVMNTLLKNKQNANSEQIITITADKKLVEEKIKLIKEHLVELQNNNEQLIEEKKQRIKETNEQIETLKKSFENLENIKKELEIEIKDEQSISKKINQLSSLKHQIEAKLAIINKDVAFFKKHDNCPTCKQAIDENFKTETLEIKSKEVEEINEGLSKLSEQYEKANENLNAIMEIHTKINDQKMEIHKVKTKISSLIDYKEQLEKDINNINKTNKDIDDSKIPELENHLKDIEVKYNDLVEDKNTLSYAGYLLKDGGIKAKIIRQYIPIINKLINKYLSAMEFMCQFELDEQFNETIKSRYRDEFSYSSFSEGEKMRINLAILFTWRTVAKLRNSINTNLLIMDEVFDSSLDANGTEEFLKILNSLTSDTNTFIISHKGDQLFDKFDKVVKFEKYKNFSRMV
jgi:DNA repair exonuclease SbcCD ATPase subunit